MTTGNYPIRNEWASVLGVTTATSLSLTILSGVALTNWENLGASGSLYALEWDGTATGTVKVRSSAQRPDITTDAALIDPSPHWQTARCYDPANGLPAAPWVNNTGGNASMVGGKLRIITTGYSQRFYQYNAGILNAGKLTMLRCRITPVSGGADQQIYANLPLGGAFYGGGCQVVAGITYNGTNYYLVSGPTNLYRLDGLTTGNAIDIVLRVVTTAVSLRPGMFEVLFRIPDATQDEDSIDGFIVGGQVATQAANDYPSIAFGGYWSYGLTADWGKVKYFAGDEWVTLTDGQLVSSLTSSEQQALSRQWQQAKGWQNGTLTSLRFKANNTAPAAPASVTLHADQDDLIATWATVANCEYKAELHNGTSVIATKFTGEDTAAAFKAPGDGNYTVRVTSVNTSNVESASYAESVVTALPETGGTTPPTINGTMQHATNPSVIYGLTKDENNMFIIPPIASWGSGNAGTVALWEAASLTGVFTEVPSSEVNYVDQTFNVPVGAVNYALVDEWAEPNAAKYYKAIYTNSAGFVVHTAIVSGNAAADNEINVQFNGLDRAPANSKVTVYLSKAVKYGTDVYETGPYEATVEGGNALVTGLPRLAKDGFTDLAGGVTSLYAIVRLPDGSEANYELTDAGAINFVQLEPYTGTLV